MHVEVQTNEKLRLFQSPFWLCFWNKQEWKKLVKKWGKLVLMWILAVLLSLKVTKAVAAPRYLVCGVLSVLGLWNKELEGQDLWVEDFWQVAGCWSCWHGSQGVYVGRNDFYFLFSCSWSSATVQFSISSSNGNEIYHLHPETLLIFQNLGIEGI